MEGSEGKWQIGSEEASGPLFHQLQRHDGIDVLATFLIGWKRRSTLFASPPATNHQPHDSEIQGPLATPTLRRG